MFEEVVILVTRHRVPPKHHILRRRVRTQSGAFGARGRFLVAQLLLLLLLLLPLAQRLQQVPRQAIPAALHDETGEEAAQQEPEHAADHPDRDRQTFGGSTRSGQEAVDGNVGGFPQIAGPEAGGCEIKHKAFNSTEQKGKEGEMIESLKWNLTANRPMQQPEA